MTDDVIDAVLAQWRQERPDLDASPVAVFGRLRRVSSMALHELGQFLKGYELSPGAFDVLANLRRSGSPYRKTPSELAESTLLTTGAITGRLDSLVAEGLIERVPNPSDRRIMYAQLTASGMRLIDQVFESHLRREHMVLSCMSATQCSQLAACLASFEKALEMTMDESRELTASVR